MGKTKITQLSGAQRQELTDGHRSGKSHAFRQCCQMILLKGEKRASCEIGHLLGCHKTTVNEWVKRYQDEGTKGLKMRPGRGRRAILSASTDSSKVRAAVARSWQRISLVHIELENDLENPFSTATLKRFLKKTVAASKE